MNFRVGQKVVCVDASARGGVDAWRHQKPNLTKGAIYTIRGVEARAGITGVYLYEAQSHGPPFSDGGERSFWPDRFRPVVEKATDISIFTGMLKPRELVRLND